MSNSHACSNRRLFTRNSPLLMRSSLLIISSSIKTRCPSSCNLRKNITSVSLLCGWIWVSWKVLFYLFFFRERLKTTVASLISGFVMNALRKNTSERLYFEGYTYEDNSGTYSFSKSFSSHNIAVTNFFNFSCRSFSFIFLTTSGVNLLVFNSDCFVFLYLVLKTFEAVSF